MQYGYFALTESKLMCVDPTLSRWADFTALPIGVRRRHHQSVRVGETTGGWSVMREHVVQWGGARHFDQKL